MHADELAAHLADLDAELADSLLGSAAEREVSVTRMERARSAVSRDLVAVASVARPAGADREPIVRVVDELGRYFELAARARALQGAGDGDAMLQAVHEATQRMHDGVLPAVAAIDGGDRAAMDAQYDDSLRSSRLYEAEALSCGALIAGILLSAQVFVARRMRRRLVPGLLVATALTALFTGYLVNRFHVARENLRVARDDAFNSMHVLWRATVIAYDLRGDEGRWLLDPARAGEYEAAYRSKLSQLWSRPASMRVDYDQIRRGQVTGLLVDEARNVTFEGEAGAAKATIAALGDFVAVDDAVRQLDRQGRHRAAVEKCAGQDADGSRATFDRLDEALGRTIEINRRAFDAAVVDSDRALRRAEWLDPALALALAWLAWLGVRPRLREYA
ncbi:MAG: hypothetical protein ACRELB_15810 [Polyangiaceae bacterium]